MNSWLTKFVQNPRSIGAIAPSSSALGQLMTKTIARDANVLELGPGTGSLTKHILQKLATPSQLTLIESDPDLAELCRQRFSGVTVHVADAESLLTTDHATYDVIVSGIPFAAMEPAKRLRMFRCIKQRLTPDGQFIMFQYSTLTRGELQSLFGTVETSFTPFNLPPAFVFTARAHPATTATRHIPDHVDHR